MELADWLFVAQIFIIDTDGLFYSVAGFYVSLTIYVVWFCLFLCAAANVAS